jgi:ribosome-binding factor A
MSQGYRREKLSKEIVREASQILQQEIRDPRLGLVSVTKAEVSPDFRYAKVFVSVYGDDRKKRRSMMGLRHATGFVQAELSRRIRLRIFPEIRFVLDESIDKAFKITKIIDDLAKKRRAKADGEEE